MRAHPRRGDREAAGRDEPRRPLAAPAGPRAAGRRPDVQRRRLRRRAVRRAAQRRAADHRHRRQPDQLATGADGGLRQRSDGGAAALRRADAGRDRHLVHHRAGARPHAVHPPRPRRDRPSLPGHHRARPGGGDLHRDVHRHARAVGADDRSGGGRPTGGWSRWCRPGSRSTRSAATSPVPFPASSGRRWRRWRWARWAAGCSAAGSAGRRTGWTGAAGPDGRLPRRRAARRPRGAAAPGRRRRRPAGQRRGPPAARDRRRPHRPVGRGPRAARGADPGAGRGAHCDRRGLRDRGAGGGGEPGGRPGRAGPPARW